MRRHGRLHDEGTGYIKYNLHLENITLRKRRLCVQIANHSKIFENLTALKKGKEKNYITRSGINMWNVVLHKSELIWFLLLFLNIYLFIYFIKL